jgi:hypothetical protein
LSIDLEVFDTLALALGIFMQTLLWWNPEVALKTWKSVKRGEGWRLANFSTPITVSAVAESLLPRLSYGMEGAHLLLNGLTSNFPSRASWILKWERKRPQTMHRRKSVCVNQAGVRTTEENSGFRIVGMQIYDPKHADVYDPKGFRRDPSLRASTREYLLDAAAVIFVPALNQ